jgi:hypothetical protein
VARKSSSASFHLCHLDEEYSTCRWRGDTACFLADLAWNAAYERGLDVRRGDGPAAVGFSIDGSVCSTCVQVYSASERRGCEENDCKRDVLVALDLVPPGFKLEPEEEPGDVAQGQPEPPTKPLPDKLPCADCPKRPTREHPRTACPYSRFDTRPTTRAYIEWTTWFVRTAEGQHSESAPKGYWDFAAGSIANLFRRDCEKLCKVVGYPEGDAYARERDREDRAHAKREKREDRAIREGREPGKVGRPPGQCNDLAVKEREIDEAVEEMVNMGSSRAYAIKSVALTRGRSDATVRKVLLRVDRKRARQEPVP